jgi:hypothetical protein
MDLAITSTALSALGHSKHGAVFLTATVLAVHWITENRQLSWYEGRFCSRSMP